jgi:glycosyltransferase involved in cell wall biosynthesis
MNSKSILFFADRLPPLVGGMEMHAHYFIEYFSDHLSFPLLGTISKTSTGENILISKQSENIIDIETLPQLFNPNIIFFNSGRWIEKLEFLRKLFPTAVFIYRTGGNEILKAPLVDQDISNHKLRQDYWASTLNNTIELIITNSNFTETRLRKIGIKPSFARCVGGVNISALKRKSFVSSYNRVQLFCAARFVPYKNHHLLLSLIHQLILRSHPISLRLAGDGPLLSKIKAQAKEYKLDSIVEFLGALNNEETCKEIANADIYIQLSTDYLTKVPGGEYIHSEGMGRSILEALSAGTFIIAGKCGALFEIVDKNKGLLVDVNNVNLAKITDNVEAILKKLPIKLPFITEYSWENLFLRYEKLMLELTL